MRKKSKQQFGIPEEEEKPLEMPLEKPLERPYEEEQVEPNNDVLGVIGNLQDALASVIARLDKIENQPVEKDVQEIPQMEQINNDDENKVEEEVHVGGEDKPVDFKSMGDAGKANGNGVKPENPFEEIARAMHSMANKMENLTGVPEIPRGKEEKPINDTSGIPATKQPAVGEAPSGGGFDSDDNKAEDEAKEAEGEVDKPTKDWKKPAVTYNKRSRKEQNEDEDEEDEEKKVEEQNGDDPSEPVPGETQDKPDEMEMPKVAEEMFKKFRGEINAEKLMKRQTLVGSEALDRRTPKNNQKAQEFLKSKEKANEIVREFLKNSKISLT